MLILWYVIVTIKKLGMKINFYSGWEINCKILKYEQILQMA